ncbi:MAG: HD-GYP domain-containing protein [Pseudomonadota bacterium]
MRHRVRTTDLELGMFLHSLEGPWLEHPFWRSRFLLTSSDQLQKLRASGIDWAMIDDRKGKGLPEIVPEAIPEKTESAHVKKSGRRRETPQPVPRRSNIMPPPQPEIRRLSGRERASAVRKASTVIKHSRTAVMSLFDDARLGNSVKSEKMAPLVDKIADSVDIDPTIILNMARLKTKDEYTYLHSVAVSALMINLGRKLNVPEDQIHDIGMAGLLHDVGKTAIPDDILMKPGKLDEAEWTTVRNHPERGHQILSASEGVCDIALEVCLRHHEKMDGTGYPGRLSADNLSLFTRMSAICDVYDALTSQRAYNKPLSASRALAKMQSWSGHFDQLVLRDFADSLGILPAGTLVRMDEDELAVVIGESPKDYAAPIVRCFHSLDTGKAIKPKVIDTGRKRARSVLAVEDPEDFGFADWSAMSKDMLAI